MAPFSPPRDDNIGKQKSNCSPNIFAPSPTERDENSPQIPKQHLVRVRAAFDKLGTKAREKFRKTLVLNDNLSQAYTDLFHYDLCLATLDSK